MLPIILRIVVTIVWYGVQSFTGGLLVSSLLSTIFPTFQRLHNTLPESTNMTTKQFVGFIIYNVIALPLLYLPPDKLRIPLRVALIASACTIFGLAIGLMGAAGDIGNYASQEGSASSGSQLGWAFMHGITTLVGGNSVGMTSQTDFSRFARRPGNQLWGQAFGVLFFGIVVPVFGVLGTSAASKLYGDVVELGLWNPPNIVQLWLETDYSPKMRAAAFFTSLGLLLFVLALNSVENGVSGGMDFAGLIPKYINIRRGSYIIAAISIAINPWQILAKATTFTAALNSFGIILGPMMGVFTADYYLVRKQKLKLSDLYHSETTGIYWFWKGINFRSYVAWILGFGPSIGGMAGLDENNSIPIGLTRVFYLGFIIGYAISFLAHWGLNVVFPPTGLGEMDMHDVVSRRNPFPIRKHAMLTFYSLARLPSTKLASSASSRTMERRGSPASKRRSWRPPKRRLNSGANCHDRFLLLSKYHSYNYSVAYIQTGIISPAHYPLQSKMRPLSPVEVKAKTDISALSEGSDGKSHAQTPPLTRSRVALTRWKAHNHIHTIIQ